MRRQLFQLAPHDFHAEEQQPQSEDPFSHLFHFFIFENTQSQPQNNGWHYDRSDLERHQLRSNGRFDVGSENDPDGLRKSQKTGIDETDDHDGGDAG